jgi:hypothetical protein
MPRPVRPQPAPGDVIIVLAAAATFVFSFFDWANDANAWGHNNFPIAALVPIYGLLMAGQIIADFVGADLPRDVAGLTWPRLHLALGVMAGLLAIGFAVLNVTDKQVGLWLEVLGGLALAVGAVVLHRDRRTEVSR